MLFLRPPVTGAILGIGYDAVINSSSSSYFWHLHISYRAEPKTSLTLKSELIWSCAIYVWIVKECHASKWEKSHWSSSPLFINTVKPYTYIKYRRIYFVFFLVWWGFLISCWKPKINIQIMSYPSCTSVLFRNETFFWRQDVIGFVPFDLVRLNWLDVAAMGRQCSCIIENLGGFLFIAKDPVHSPLHLNQTGCC